MHTVDIPTDIIYAINAFWLPSRKPGKQFMISETCQLSHKHHQ